MASPCLTAAALQTWVGTLTGASTAVCIGNARRGGGRSWAVAAAGDPRGRWDADALRDIVRDYVVETLSADDAVLVIDEAGFLKDIFDRYLRLGNMRQLHKELLSSGIVKPDRTTATGRAYGSAPGWIVAPCAAGTRSLSTGTSRSAISCWDELLSRRATSPHARFMDRQPLTD